jgi:hypothetical protein
VSGAPGRNKGGIDRDGRRPYTGTVKSAAALAVVLLLRAAPAFADDASSRYAAAYLQQPMSARALGMGDAYVALCNDTAAIYYNPAGLAFLSYSGFGSMYSPQSFDQTVWTAEYVQATERFGGFGAAAVVNDIGGIEGRSDEFSVPTTITSREGAILLSYGYAPAKRWSFGATAKYLYHRFTNLPDSGSGEAFDLGVKGAPFADAPLIVGASAQNIAGRFRWSTGRQDPELFVLKTGAAYKLGRGVAAVLDADFRGDRTVRVHAGAELTRSVVSVRLGADHDHPTFGVGITGPKAAVRVRVDYAFELDPSGFEDIHRLGLSIRF